MNRSLPRVRLRNSRLALLIAGTLAFSPLLAADALSQRPMPAAAPNVVLILLDDVGFSAASTFGGATPTPGLDRLAADGLRYNNFNVTGICSPTRASLLSGRNHHRMGFGTVSETSGNHPGYDATWKKSTASVAAVLKHNGYSTAAFGKWHNTPYSETGPLGPFERWPTGLGFEYFYGMMLGEISEWEPPLYRGTTPVEPTRTPQQGYHFTTDITDEAIRWLHTHESLAPNKPYLMYFAPAATHAPHHVPQEWIEKYRGKFDAGWDKLREETFARQKKLGVIPANTKLTPRPAELPAWNSLSAQKQQLLARQMEIYAAYLAHTDHEVDRLIRAIQEGPRGDNTLIVYAVGDNGSSGEGGPDGSDIGFLSMMNMPNSLERQLQRAPELGSPLYDNHYSAAWAWATNTPFQWMKAMPSHFGATRTPLIVSWPARIKDHGGLRPQFTHVNDVVATVYEVAGVEAPAALDGVKQEPLDGISFAYSFDDAAAPARRRVQYFEQGGNRAIYQDGWVAAARHYVPWVWDRSDNFDQDRWELYHVAEDFSEAHDLAGRYPDKLKSLQALFDSEARANHVYPLGGGYGEPPKAPDRYSYVYYPDLPRTPLVATPDLTQSHRLVADVMIPEGGAEGAILAAGGRWGGFVMYVKDNRLVCENNFAGLSRDVMISRTPLPSGKAQLIYEFAQDEATKDRALWDGISGTARMYVNGQLAGEAKLRQVARPIYFGFGSFTVGQALGMPISDAYQAPFKFTGVLEKVRVELQQPAHDEE